jgi:hypothetical protein
MPDAGPFGETRFETKAFAMVAALFVNKPFSGCVESVVTVATHRRFDDLFAPDLFLFVFMTIRSRQSVHRNPVKQPRVYDAFLPNDVVSLNPHNLHGQARTELIDYHRIAVCGCTYGNL